MLLISTLDLNRRLVFLQKQSIMATALLVLCLLTISGSVLGQTTEEPDVGPPVEPEEDFVCEMPEKLPKQIDFPNVFDNLAYGSDSVSGYKTAIELNVKDADNNGGYTRFSQETVDTINEHGKVSLRYGKKSQTRQDIVYFLTMSGDEDHRKSFTVQDGACVGNGGNNVTKAYDKTNWFPKVFQENSEGWFSDVSDELLGPSAILRIGFINSANFTYIKRTRLRGFRRVNVFKACIKRQDGRYSVLNYYFANKASEVGQIPLRVEVSTKSEPTFHYVFAYFEQLLKQPEIAIPTGYGCRQPEAIPKDAVPELLLDKDFAMDMEVVMESGDNGELDGQVYDAKVVYSKAYGLVSFTQSKLRLEAIDKNEDQFRFNVKSVVDLNEGIQYTKNMVTSACSTSRIDLDIKGRKESGPKDIWDKMPPFEFKDNIKFKILDSDLWQPGSDGQFLGTATVRGFPTVVYESQFTDKYDDGLGGDKSMRKVTVTKYYLDGDMSYDSNFMAKGAPVKIIVRVYDEDGISWDKVITMNMHSFEAGIIQQLDPIAAFDVSDCFNQPGQSQWFQMNFPETDFSKLTMSEYIPGIEKAFRAELSEISPLRMPKVLVDFDLNQLTITAKLLGRPSYLATFKSTKDTQVTSKPIYIIGTIDDCAKICENSPNCNGFSFCDESLECAIWQQSKADETMPSEAASGCTANQRVAALVPSVEPPMNQMSTESVFRIIEQQISLETGFKISTMVTYPDGTMGDIVLGASELVRDVDPGWLSTQSRKGRLNFADLTKGISDFAVYARRSRLSAVDSDKKPVSGFTRYVGVKWRGCSNLCRDNPDCQMFSFCDKGDGDCVISTISSAKIDKASIETNTGCTVMQKSKIRAFMQYPSFSLVSLALKEEKVDSLDTCATKCSEETEFMCRSFDYCLDESSPKSYYCLMHEYHVSATAAQKVVEQTKGTDMKFNRTATGCIHYARQYSDDFKRTAKVKMGKDVGIIFQSGEMSLEMCSYHCSQNIGDSCQAFEFCDRVTLDKRVERTCQMTSDKVAASSTEMDPECSVYGRSSLDGGQGSGTRKPFASSGVAWFGAIVFLGIGSAIGFLVYKHRFAGVPA